MCNCSKPKPTGFALPRPSQQQIQRDGAAQIATTVATRPLGS